MDWHVQHRDGASHHIGRHLSPEQAIQSACQLIDEGHDVYGIGVGGIADSIGPAAIARICSMCGASRRNRFRPV